MQQKAQTAAPLTSNMPATFFARSLSFFCAAALHVLSLSNKGLYDSSLSGADCGNYKLQIN